MIAIGWPETNGVFIDTSALPKFNTLDTNSGKSQNVKMLLPPLACLKMLFQNVALSELKSFPHPCLEMCKHYEILQLFENLKKLHFLISYINNINMKKARNTTINYKNHSNRNQQHSNIQVSIIYFIWSK